MFQSREHLLRKPRLVGENAPQGQDQIFDWNGVSAIRESRCKGWTGITQQPKKIAISIEREKLQGDDWQGGRFTGIRLECPVVVDPVHFRQRKRRQGRSGVSDGRMKGCGPYHRPAHICLACLVVREPMFLTIQPFHYQDVPRLSHCICQRLVVLRDRTRRVKPQVEGNHFCAGRR